MRTRDPHLTVNDRDWLARGGVLVANGRWVPPADLDVASTLAGPAWVGTCDGKPACAWVGPEDASDLEPNAVDDWFEDLAQRVECREVGGEWIARPWDLVAKNSAHIVRDFDAEGKVGLSNRHLTSIALVGPADRIFIHESARVDPYTVFDTTNGPITIGAGVVVQQDHAGRRGPSSSIQGREHLGSSAGNLRGGVASAPTAGSAARSRILIVPRPLEAKPHEGFLGHSYVGECGEPRQRIHLQQRPPHRRLRRGPRPTFEATRWPPARARGSTASSATTPGPASRCILLDPGGGHRRWRSATVLPAGLLLPKHVPSFAAVLFGRVAPGFTLEQLFATAEIVMGRRGKAFTPAERQLYLDLYEQTRLERERALQKTHDRRGDSWPVLMARR